MVNLEKKLTVDDLIVEYMMYKVKNGYEPSYTTLEFMDFLHFFETKMKVEDTLENSKELFKRFFERKIEHEWSSYDEPKPHMNIKYNEEINDYVISANYRFSDYDKSVINTYFMNNNWGSKNKTVSNIRNIIGEYLSDKPKRIIDERVEVSENDLLVGKYISAEIVTQIWYSFIEKQIQSNKWPRQCKDINKYLFDMDLAEIIELGSIKKDIIELYETFSKRIAVLYNQDRELKVSSYTNCYLARANYELLIQDYESIISIAFGEYKKNLEFDLTSSTFKESHETGELCYWDEDPEIKITTTAIDNDNVKQLVKNIEKNKR